MNGGRRDELLKSYIEASATLREGAMACHEAGLPAGMGQFNAAFHIAQDAATELLASYGIDVNERCQLQ